MKAPKWDPNFANSGMHGIFAQREKLMATIKYCSNRRAALDVGAHIGTWTVELAKHFKLVQAIEPVLENFLCLEANTSKLKNVLAYNVACGARAESGKMVKHGGNSGCYYFAPGKEMLSAPIDAFEFAGIDLIKIDVEGFEGDIVLGARETIRRDRPVVIFEDNGLGEKHYGHGWVDPKLILQDLGYVRQARHGKDEIWVSNSP